ncbi:ribonuclease H2 subunit C [Anticarsia gemmatalis]|uniref:ribonuclease H2 subunit C n=1 Tax=Anticarsia gemmatalis TaxID=129554 RepID=UPI003F75D278
MSIIVENNLKNTENQEIFEQKAHYIPCKIEDDGPANVQKYFDTYVKETDGELTASFRGHPLDGAKLKVPEGYSAIIVTEAKRPLAEDSERKFQVAGGFKEFINWNWDKKPSQNDNIVRAMDWIDISEAIHGD